MPKPIKHSKHAKRRKVQRGISTSMSSRFWIAAIALVLFAPIAAQGQEKELPNQPQPPAEEEQSTANTLPIPLPVQIIEDNETAKARARQEAEARQREAEDLVAQQGMNTATQAMNKASQDMAIYSLISTVLVGIGTALLFYTLYLTWQANKSARNAVSVTRCIGQAQTRAHILLTFFDCEEFDRPARTLTVSIGVKNVGITPIYQYAMFVSCEIVTGNKYAPIKEVIGQSDIVFVNKHIVPSSPDPKSNLQNEYAISNADQIEAAFASAFKQTQKSSDPDAVCSLRFSGDFYFKDIFGQAHRTPFEVLYEKNISEILKMRPEPIKYLDIPQICDWPEQPQN